MIVCDKCGFGHHTTEEARACKSWKETVEACIAAGHPIIHRDWHISSMEWCACGQRTEPRERKVS